MTLPLPEFQLERPRDVQAALAVRRAHPESRFLAGGTDLLVNIRGGLYKPTRLIDLSGIDELSSITFADATCRIGAGVTLATLAEHPQVQKHFRAVSEAALAVAGPTHRSMATVGGNLCLDTRCIYYNQSEWWRKANHYCLKRGDGVCHVAPQGERCHAAFSGDLAPALIALGAQVEIAGADGRRTIPLAELYAEEGRAHLKLKADELVVAAHLPLKSLCSGYEKARVRGAIDFPLAGVAVALAANGDKVTDLRVALTGTNSRPFLLAGTDAFLGRPLDDGALQQIDKLVQKQVQPMRTTLMPANYRRLVAAALASRLAARLFAEACKAA